ncbi:MAG: N-6 DNA methylase [Cyclobacteriaceae bacterium]
MKKEQYQLLIEFIRTGKSDLEKLIYGWGALKELLLPIDDLNSWTESDLKYHGYVEEVHAALKEAYGEQDGKRVLNSIKSSLLTSFYTPIEIIDPIVETIKKNVTGIQAILDPSAGTGNFIPVLKESFPEATITAIEKDFITAQMLKARFKGITSHHAGFEEDKSTGYDLIISNIPFGSIAVYDADYVKERNPVKIKSTTRIHNYFFTKSLDKVNDKGVVAFITSSSFSDAPGNKEIREYLMSKADLIDVVRLPDSIFKGTKASSDIVIIQKNDGKKIVNDRENDFISTDRILLKDPKGEEKEVNINQFISTRPEKVLGQLVCDGQYGNDSAVVKSTESLVGIGIRLKEEINNSFHLNDGIVITKKTEKEEPKPLLNGRIGIEPGTVLHPLLVNGNLIVYNKQIGRYYYEMGLKQFEFVPVIKDVEKAASLIQMRDTYKELLKLELENGDANLINLTRGRLNEQYDLHSWRHGFVNHSPAIIGEDVEDHIFVNLEKPDGKGFKKTEIFTQRTNNQEKEVLDTVNNLNDAVLYSLNAVGMVDTVLMASLLKKTPEEIITEGLQSKRIFLAPELINEQINWVPVTSEEYLSGNVVEKLKLLNQNLNSYPDQNKEQLQVQLDALVDVQPAIVPFELMDLNLGERWVPMDIYESFAKEIFEADLKITYLESTDEFKVNLLEYSGPNTTSLAVSVEGRTLKGSTILEYALGGTSPNLTKELPNGSRVPNQEAMQLVEAQIDNFKKKFNEYFFVHQKDRTRLENIYNERFNNIQLREYDGSHLTLDNLQNYEPFQHQKDAVWMLLQQFGGIVDHKVGAGKTLVMVIAAMEMRRLKMAKKPLIIAMKANAGEIYQQDFMKAYPDAKVLFPKDNDFTPKNRKNLFFQIMNNDWDCVILTHDQFKAIPSDRDMTKLIIEEELEGLEADMTLLHKEGNTASKQKLKGLEKRKIKLNTQLQMQIEQMKKDSDIPDFKQMGFDHLFVDESQVFKNLLYTTHHSNVAGLGTPAGSQRALNLLIATRSLQQKHGGDKGVTFLSGTTISNSLVELYLLFKYLRPEALKAVQINSFDSWAAVFGVKSTEYEFSVTGDVKRKERFRKFVKVQELSKFYREIAHVVTDQNFPVAKPNLENIFITVPPTPGQENFIQDLIQFAKTKDGTWINKPDMSDNEKAAYMLLATSLATKMSLDMRLIYPHIGFEEGCKLAHVSENVAKIYNETSSFKGTQLIFCDTGTPSAKKNAFSAYREIKEILIHKFNIPPHEIQFIHDHDSTRKKKKAFFKEINDGNVRVAIGSTVKMGTGVNVQKRVMAMHHLDLPWRPADVEQRNGRGARQGNIMAKQYGDNKVRSYTYAVERSLDAYRASVLDHKGKMINQFKTASLDVRRIDEGGISEDGAMNMAELVALLSGNQDLLVRAKKTKELQTLEMKYAAFYSEKSYATRKQEGLEDSIKNSEQSLASLQNDKAYLEKFEATNIAPPPTKEAANRHHYPQPVIINEFFYGKSANGKPTIEYREKPLHDIKAIGELLHKTLFFLKAAGADQNMKVGRYGDFELRSNWQQRIFITRPSSKITYTYNNGDLNNNPVLAGRYVVNCFDKISNLITNEIEHIDILKKQYASNIAVINREFNDLDKITELKEEIAKIDESLNGKDIIEKKETHIPTHVRFKLLAPPEFSVDDQQPKQIRNVS